MEIRNEEVFIRKYGLENIEINQRDVDFVGRTRGESLVKSDTYIYDKMTVSTELAIGEKVDVIRIQYIDVSGWVLEVNTEFEVVKFDDLCHQLKLIKKTPKLIESYENNR